MIRGTKHTRYERERGFTLIEVLIVIGILAVLASIVVVAINPAKQFAQARNIQRESHVNTILSAIGQNLADHQGIFTCADIGTPIGTTTADIGVGEDFVNLNCLVPTYIPTAIPEDPTAASASTTGYTILVDTIGRYTVCAPAHTESAVPDSRIYCLTR